MTNVWEFTHDLNPDAPYDSGLDADGDWFTNVEEYWRGSDPRNADENGDGVADGIPFYANRINGAAVDIIVLGSDWDGDGVLNWIELRDGSNLREADLDGDGMDDSWELAFGLDPATNDSGDDHDEDGLTNLEEFRRGTHPDNDDTDGDGMPDAWELSHQLDPRIDESQGEEDPDGDDVMNWQEGLNGTNPFDNRDDDDDGIPDDWER